MVRTLGYPYLKTKLCLNGNWRVNGNWMVGNGEIGLEFVGFAG